MNGKQFKEMYEQSKAQAEVQIRTEFYAPFDKKVTELEKGVQDLKKCVNEAKTNEFITINHVICNVETVTEHVQELVNIAKDAKNNSGRDVSVYELNKMYRDDKVTVMANLKTLICCADADYQGTREVVISKDFLLDVLRETLALVERN